MTHGVNGPYIGNVVSNARLGIPALNLNDGPQVRVGKSACARGRVWIPQ
jgi:hypothetical protein